MIWTYERVNYNSRCGGRLEGVYGFRSLVYSEEALVIDCESIREAIDLFYDYSRS